MNEFYTLQHLVCEHKYRFQAKFSFTVVKEIFEARPQQINNHYIIIAFYTKPVHIGHANASLEDSVQFSLIKQLRMLRSHRLEFDCDFFVGAYVRPMINIPKRPTPQFS